MAGMSLTLQRCGPGLVAESIGRESPGVPEVGVGPAAGMQTSTSTGKQWTNDETME